MFSSCGSMCGFCVSFLSSCSSLITTSTTRTPCPSKKERPSWPRRPPTSCAGVQHARARAQHDFPLAKLLRLTFARAAQVLARAVGARLSGHRTGRRSRMNPASSSNFVRVSRGDGGESFTAQVGRASNPAVHRSSTSLTETGRIYQVTSSCIDLDFHKHPHQTWSDCYDLCESPPVRVCSTPISPSLTETGRCIDFLGPFKSHEQQQWGDCYDLCDAPPVRVCAARARLFFMCIHLSDMAAPVA